MDRLAERPACQRGTKVPFDMAKLKQGDGKGAKKFAEDALKMVTR